MQLRRERVHQCHVVQLEFWRWHDRQWRDDIAPVLAQPDLHRYPDDAADFLELDGVDVSCVQQENLQLTLSM